MTFTSTIEEPALRLQAQSPPKLHTKPSVEPFKSSLPTMEDLKSVYVSSKPVSDEFEHPTKMKAWLIHNPSEDIKSSMRFFSDAIPPPASNAPNHLLVRILRMSTNPMDYKISENRLFSRFIVGVNMSLPASPGQDYAGIVVSAGSAITHVKVGDTVMGRLDGPQQYGCLAEYSMVDPAGCMKVPANLTLDEAAATGTASLTAYQSTVPFLNANAGEKVFINGGSGGVGTYAIQYAKIMGAYVVVSCSGRNRHLCKALGADEVVDYTQGDLVEQLKQTGHVFNLVVDYVGNRPSLYREMGTCIQPKGRFTQIGARFGLLFLYTLAINYMISLFGGRGTFMFMEDANKMEDWNQIVSWLGQGLVKPVLDSVYEFKDAQEAYAKQKSGRARGGIVVRVSDT